MATKRMTKRAAGKPRRDIYQEVTDRILELLDQDLVPWKSPIRGAAGWPKSLVSGKRYRGVNVFLLAMTALAKDYRSPWWLTYKQAAARGGNVKQGEKGTRIIFWKKLIGDDEQVERDENGKPAKAPFVLRGYTVFNAAAQCEGLEVPVEPNEIDLDHTPIEAAERIIAGYPNPPTIVHGGARAFYRRGADEVHLPKPERFESDEAYYETGFHELGHSTGHKTRLDRLEDDPAPFGSLAYGKEELVAEFTAAMLCGEAGIIPATVADHASYIAGWKKAIKAEKKLVVNAAAQAQRAADHILGVSWDEDDDNATKPAADPTAVRLSDDLAAWDFEKVFPPVLPTAIENGNLVPEDTTPEAVAALHKQHAAECRQMLQEQQRLQEALEQGVHPETGRKPRKPHTRQRLRDDLTRRIDAITLRFGAMIESYADAFGARAVVKFDAHVRQGLEDTKQCLSPSPDPMGPDIDRYPVPVKLQWDFRTRFPLPTDEAIDKGWVDAKDTTPIGLVNLHSEYERELTVRLDDVDAATASIARQALERILGDLLDSYAEAFGVTAAHQFKIATDCRRRGERVVIDPNHQGPGLPVDADKLLDNKPAGAPPPVTDIEPAAPTGLRVSHAPDEVMAAEADMSPEEARARHNAHQLNLFV